MVKRDIPRDLLSAADGEYLEFGGHRIPITEAQGTSLMMGISRSGKSLEQKTLMASALRAIRRGSDRRAVILDAKGDLLPIVWKACKEQRLPLWYFNLADRRTIAPHIARDLEGRPDKVYEFFKIVIPEPERGERFWSQTAQILGSAIALTLYQEQGESWGLHDLYRKVLSDIPALIGFLQLHPQGKDIAARYLPTDTGQNTQYGFLTQLTVSIQQLELAAVNQYHTPKARWFSLRDFIESDGVFLIGANSDVRKATNPIVQALFRLYVNFISRLPDSRSRKLFTFIDEVSFWGKIDGLDELHTFCPSKGAVNALVVQGIEQLYALYGEHTARAIAGQSVIKLLFHPTDSTSARWMVDQMGQFRVYEVRRSSSFGRGGESYSKSEDFVMREPVTTGELFNLPLASPRSGNHFYLHTPWTGW
ncbi:MAG: type IV secretion system DNA-binding domain-containing protein [Pseudanabaena sp. SU_2_4]|nr:type IV secretion system DNA-binding domain-containing protein [Pseudanabaena sp. SU_2_4]